MGELAALVGQLRGLGGGDASGAAAALEQLRRSGPAAQECGYQSRSSVFDNIYCG